MPRTTSRERGVGDVGDDQPDGVRALAAQRARKHAGYSGLSAWPARITLSRTPSLTSPSPRKTRLTVLLDTPDLLATSTMVTRFVESFMADWERSWERSQSSIQARPCQSPPASPDGWGRTTSGRARSPRTRSAGFVLSPLIVGGPIDLAPCQTELELTRRPRYDEAPPQFPLHRPRRTGSTTRTAVSSTTGDTICSSSAIRWAWCGGT